MNHILRKKHSPVPIIYIPVNMTIVYSPSWDMETPKTSSTNSCSYFLLFSSFFNCSWSYFHTNFVMLPPFLIPLRSFWWSTMNNHSVFKDSCSIYSLFLQPHPLLSFSHPCLYQICYLLFFLNFFCNYWILCFTTNLLLCLTS